jgi:uncharacterized protein (DUF433 family)
MVSSPPFRRFHRKRMAIAGSLSFNTCLSTLPHMAALPPLTARLPLFADPYGTLRVHGTRVTLESIVTAFRAGATAEEIAQKFPSVPLADVYLIIAHYLHHTDEIDSYLSGQRAEAAALRYRTEQRFDACGLRSRLLARCEFKNTAR